ncbi:MAG: CBS domain-containing protein [Anaerolineae bacterium]|nr:MAG: CBS domain-containing protein [Anaerolineae bacterium]
MFIVQDILKTKGQDVWTVTTDTSVGEALTMMKEHNIGALLVMEEGKPAGVFSERDLARGLAGRGDFSLHTPVKTLMTSPVVTVTPTTTIEACMALMTDKRIRHLPVMQDDHLLGIISIGDVVKGMLTHKDGLIRQLENYIAGTDYGK